MSKILVRGARQLLTLRGPNTPRRGLEMRELAIIEDGALLICDGVIREVGPTRRIEKLTNARNAEEIEANGRIVMPGFVDCSTNLLEASRMGARSWSRARLELEAKDRLRLFTRHGTTTVEAKVMEALDLRALAALDSKPLNIVSTLFVQDTAHPVFKPVKNWPPRVCVDCSEQGVSLDAASSYLNQAKSLGFSIHIHGGRSVALALETGAVTLNQPEVTDQYLTALAKSSTITTFLPALSFQDSQQYGPARELLDRGAAVALATGFSASKLRTVSMSMILSLACSQMQMSVAESIVATTVNSAHALGMSRRVGSLEVGKQADLLMLDTTDYRDLSAYFGVNLISMMMKKGKVLFHDQKTSIWND